MDTTKSIKLANPIKGCIHSPVPNGHCSQGFGENVKLYASINIGLTKGHNGRDYVAPYGTPIYAVEGGLVCEVKNDAGGFGKHIRILTGDPKDKTVQREWTYGHNSENFVKVGDIVQAGQYIANMGNTGFVVSDVNALGFWVKGSNKYSGTHLHLGVREFKYDKKGWSYYPNTPKITILNYNNGSLGCVDFATWFQEAPYGDTLIKKAELKYASDDPVWWNNFLNLLKFLRANQ